MFYPLPVFHSVCSLSLISEVPITLKSVGLSDLPVDFKMYPQIWHPEGTVHVQILKASKTNKKKPVYPQNWGVKGTVYPPIFRSIGTSGWIGADQTEVAEGYMGTLNSRVGGRGPYYPYLCVIYP